MAVFEYHALDSHGVRVEGELDAADLGVAQLQLKAQGLTPLKVSPRRAGGVQLGGRGLRSLGLADMELMTSELALLLKSGVRIDKGLAVLARGAGNGVLGPLLQSLSQSVRQGESLSAALAQQSVFDPMYVNLVQMGEASGQLGVVFERLAQDLQFRRELRARILQAITYPCVILLVCIASLLFVFNFIVPRMSGLFAASRELPVYTELLLGVSQWMQQYQVFLFIGVVGVVGSLVWAAGQGQLQPVFSRWLAATPGLRQSVLVVNRIRYSSALAMLLGSGIRLDRAMALASDGIQPDSMKHALDAARMKVKGGAALTESLAATGLFSDLALSLIEVGEQSGQLGVVFDEVASRSRSEFEQWTARFTALLEPVMILGMGGLVGGVVVIMLLSITSLTDVAI